jgi:hypothetical protein
MHGTSSFYDTHMLKTPTMSKPASTISIVHRKVIDTIWSFSKEKRNH